MRAVDLWSELRPNRSRLQDRTCQAHNNRGLTGNIIDQVVVSDNCATGIEADIAIADRSYNFVQMIDHHAVLATLFMKPPDNLDAVTEIPADLSKNLHQLCVRYPSKRDKLKYDKYRRKVDKKVEHEGLKHQPVTGEQSFTHCYKALTRIIVDTAKEVFGVAQQWEGEDMKVSSLLIHSLEKRLRHIGGALYLERRNGSTMVSGESRAELESLQQEYQNTVQALSQQLTLCKFILNRRKVLYKELYHARMQEVMSRARIRNQKKMWAALNGGSTKRMVNAGKYIFLPTAVNSHSLPG